MQEYMSIRVQIQESIFNRFKIMIDSLTVAHDRNTTQYIQCLILVYYILKQNYIPSVLHFTNFENSVNRK